MINHKNTTKTIANRFVDPKPLLHPQLLLHPQPQLDIEKPLLHPQHPNGFVMKGLYELHPHPE